MLVFPNAKINIGLNIINKRIDGFHNIESIFYPIALTDMLEFVECSKLELTNTGYTVESDIEKNLVVKAFRMLQSEYKLPEIKIQLHKIIPFGAGLGGGSADAAFMLKALNEYFELSLTIVKLKEYAARLGSDCAFFIDNKASFAHGRGELLEQTDLSLDNYHILLVKPPLHVSTADAYAGVRPEVPDYSLKTIIKKPIEQWNKLISNDFEKSIFPKYPLIAKIKMQLYDMGAIYASMSGSGSTVYGIFKDSIEIKTLFPDCYLWQGKM